MLATNVAELIALEWLVAQLRETAIGAVAVDLRGRPQAALVGVAMTDDRDLLSHTEIRSSSSPTSRWTRRSS